MQRPPSHFIHLVQNFNPSKIQKQSSPDTSSTPIFFSELYNLIRHYLCIKQPCSSLYLILFMYTCPILNWLLCLLNRYEIIDKNIPIINKHNVVDIIINSIIHPPPLDQTMTCVSPTLPRYMPCRQSRRSLLLIPAVCMGDRGKTWHTADMPQARQTGRAYRRYVHGTVSPCKRSAAVNMIRPTFHLPTPLKTWNDLVNPFSFFVYDLRSYLTQITNT